MNEQQPDQRYRRAARLLAAKLGVEWHELPAEQVEDYIRKIDIVQASAEGRGHGAGAARLNIRPGMTVRVVQKQDQKSGKLTTGVVERLLTAFQHLGS